MEAGGGSDVPSASQAGDAKTDVPEKEDLHLLADEKFDFDLSLSSSSANEDDEVFFGPVGHKERCIAASLELNNQIPEQPVLPASESCVSWSPLAGEKFVEVYKEAHLLALRIENSNRNTAAQAAQPKDPWSQGMERFVQESKLKISLFEKEKEMKKSPRSLKRETYYLSDSMWPPAGESPLPDSSLAPLSSPRQAGLAQTQGPHPSRPLPEESSTAHPPSQAVTRRNITGRLQLPRASSLRGRHVHLAMEKPKKEVPASPSGTKIPNGKECRRDVLPDRPALGAAGLPASGSHLVQSKRLLPVPNKLGLKKTLLKPPGCAGSLARKSSSGSASSGASSVSALPAVGKAKSSEFASLPATSSQPLSNNSKSGRTGPTMLRAGAAGAPYRQARRADAERAAEQPMTPPAASPTQAQTPEGGGPRVDSDSVLSKSSQLNKTRSMRRRDSYLNSKTKVMPTPTSQFKIPRFSVGESPDSATPKFSRAQRPQSCTSLGRVIVHSTPARHSSEPAAHSLRGSALPTPAGRRLSSLPLTAPKTMPRAVASPLPVPARRLSSEPRKKSVVRTDPTTESDREVDASQADLSPDGSFSPPSSVPQALNFSPEKSDFTFSKSITTEATRDEAKPRAAPAPSEVRCKINPLTTTPMAERTPLLDLPLIDLGSTPEASGPVGPESRPLIDLMMNTPEMGRNVSAKPVQAAGQLIDLGSPLIQLSPEADKENVESPLLKF
uniref:G2 and S-phase expressed 1 n=1 Tax=Propithecus coquereli TaxID=379532 RepID=A0A2K6GPB7_PROCO